MANAQEEFAAVQKQRESLVSRERQALKTETPFEGMVHTPYRFDRSSWDMRKKLAKSMMKNRSTDKELARRAKEFSRGDYRQNIGLTLKSKQYKHVKRRPSEQYRFLGRIKSGALKTGKTPTGPVSRTREDTMALGYQRSMRPKKGNLKKAAYNRYGVYSSSSGKDSRYAQPTVGTRRGGGAAQYLISKATQQEYSALSAALL